MTMRKAATPSLSVAKFRLLESFFSGYVHEDYVAEHGSPEGALRAWRLDANAREGRQFDREAEHLLEAALSLPFEQVAAFVRRDLGSAWRPSDIERLRTLFARPTRRPRR